MATIEKRKGERGITYRAKVRVRGRDEVGATFDRRRDAERWAAETEVALRAGRYIAHREARRYTVGDAIDRYITDYLPTAKMRSEKQRRQHLAWWQSELGRVPLVDLRQPAIIDARGRLLAEKSEKTGKRRSSGTGNRFVASLSHVLTVARRDFGMLETSPAAELVNLPEPRGRVRYLTDDERTALLRECRRHSPTLHDLALTAICTGARRGELLNLRWKNVHVDRGALEFLQTKNGEIRVVPLTGPALAALRERAEVLGAGDRGDERVFTGPTKRKNDHRPWWVHDAFVDAVQRAGIKNLRFHDLRHEAASQLAMSGVDLHTIATILGHRDLKVTQRYAHLTREHLHDAVATMTARIFGAGVKPRAKARKRAQQARGE